jgi:Arc/MetJ-type ribon-helix-helix transcriptional regulator
MAKKQISIYLPAQAVDMLEILVPCGLYGDNRGQVAADLILSSLKDLSKSGDLDRLSEIAANNDDE